MIYDGQIMALFHRQVQTQHADSVDQSTDGVCGSNLPAPFQESQYPNGEVLRDEYNLIRLSPDQAHFWQWQCDPCRTFAD